MFMGSTGFGIPALEALTRNGHVVTGIVSTPASRQGRGLALADSPMTAYAKSKGFDPIITPQSLGADSVAEELRKMAADVFVVVAFRILPQSIFSIPRLGTFNIHASLLPRYRGPAPIQRAIEAGENETGITIFRIDAGIDTGGIVLSRKTGIGPMETAPQLSERLSLLGAEALAEALALVENNAAVLATQDASRACGATKLAKAEGKINWSDAAPAIFNKVRAFKPFPGTYTFIDGTRIMVEWAAVSEHSGPQTEPPGTVVAMGKNGFEVQCGNGRLLVSEVKPEGRKSMAARDFAGGRGIDIGMRFA